VLRLSHEPTAFSTLATSSSDLSTRASAVLAKIEWPGKPGASAPIAPLTPDEQKRFDAGHMVYESICLPCHKSDGRGEDHVAASLIGSQLALGPAEVTVRILMNGKEGTIGLMPPLGTTLTDEQIADVLTYVRREWGQGGTPVEPATVTAVRPLTATRTKPWTNDELFALQGAAPAGR
jgi:mono/diheme cytochrome c family protein